MLPCILVDQLTAASVFLPHSRAAFRSISAAARRHAEQPIVRTSSVNGLAPGQHAKRQDKLFELRLEAINDLLGLDAQEHGR